ncbi:MAG: zinc ABC transporter substrate-binding protein, partial [Cyanobacteria bacterium J06636_28]
MKLSLRLFTALAALGGASALLLGNQSAQSQTSPTVVASYSVLCDLTEQIAQDTVEVDCLIEAGNDPHLYSATPADRRAIETADLVLYGGYGFEPDIIQMVEATDGDTPKIAVSEVAVTDPLLGEGHDHGHGEEEDHDDHGHEDHDDHGEKEHSAHSKAGHEGHDHGEEGHGRHGLRRRGDLLLRGHHDLLYHGHHG